MQRTFKLTPEQMQSRIFRFAGRREHQNHGDDPGLPPAVFAEVNPPLYLLLAHAAAATPAASRPAIAGAKGLSVAILEIPPGQGVPLHVHLRSREAFVCLAGRARIRWNDDGEHATFLEPFDMIDLPPGVYRDYQCDGDRPVLLLGILTDPDEDDPADDILIAPVERARFAARHGHEVLARLTAATGMRFTDPDDA